MYVVVLAKKRSGRGIAVGMTQMNSEGENVRPKGLDFDYGGE